MKKPVSYEFFWRTDGRFPHYSWIKFNIYLHLTLARSIIQNGKRKENNKFNKITWACDSCSYMCLNWTRDVDKNSFKILSDQW